MVDVEKSNLDQLCSEQLVVIESRISACIQKIMNGFVETDEDPTKYNCSNLLDEDLIHELTEIFVNSDRLYKQSGVDIENEVDEHLNYLWTFNENSVMQLLVPVLFYALIRKNELNRNTQKHRGARGTEHWGSVKNIFDLPPVKIHRKEKESLKTLKDILSKQKKSLLESSYGVYQKAKLEEIIEETEELLDKDLIIQIETNALLGLFIRKILYTQMDKRNPIETVLRLYMINSFDGIVYQNGQIINGMEFDLSKNNLITQYCNDQGIDLEELFERLDAKDSNVEPKPTVVRFSINDADSFEELYRNLCAANVISIKNVKDLMDYYLNEEELIWYSECYNHLKTYAKKVIKWIDDKDSILSRVTMPDRVMNVWRLIVLNKQRELELKDTQLKDELKSEYWHLKKDVEEMERWTEKTSIFI